MCEISRDFDSTSTTCNFNSNDDVGRISLLIIVSVLTPGVLWIANVWPIYICVYTTASCGQPHAGERLKWRYTRNAMTSFLVDLILDQLKPFYVTRNTLVFTELSRSTHTMWTELVHVALHEFFAFLHCLLYLLLPLINWELQSGFCWIQRFKDYKDVYDYVEISIKK